jgi:hypothetical protein
MISAREIRGRGTDRIWMRDLHFKGGKIAGLRHHQVSAKENVPKVRRNHV